MENAQEFAQKEPEGTADSEALGENLDKNNLKEWFLSNSKRLKLIKVAPAAVALTLLCTSAFLIVESSSDNSADSPPNASETVNDYSPESTPVPTLEPTTVTTQSLQPELTSTSNSSTPEQVQTPTPEQSENIAYPFARDISIEPGVSQAEEANVRQIIAQVDALFPQIGNLKILVIPNNLASTISINPNPDEESTISLGSQTFGLTNTANEYAAFFTYNTNEAFFDKYYANANEIKILEESLLGRFGDYSLDNIFSQKMIGTDYANICRTGFGHYLAQSLEYYVNGEKQNYPLQDLLFAEFIDTQMLEQYAQKYQGVKNPYMNPIDTMDAYSADINELVKDPFIRMSLERIGISRENIRQYFGALSGYGPNLSSKTVDEFFNVTLKNIINIGATELFREQNSNFLELLGGGREAIQTNYDYLVERMDNEILARGLNLQITGEINDEEFAKKTDLIKILQ